MFVPCIHAPALGNRYYITRQLGGYSPCIHISRGNPLQDALPNCVGYATGRFNEIGNDVKMPYLGNTDAENFLWFANIQGLTVTQQPTIGGCMVWAKGQIGNAKDGYGHVAIVEQVNPDGSILTSESEFSGAVFRTRVRCGDNWGQSGAYRYIGCIANPFALPEEKTPTVTVKRGSKGAPVKWVQKMLVAYGQSADLGECGVDGAFGTMTEKALQKFQTRWGLVPDGVCGKLTKAKFLAGFGV